LATVLTLLLFADICSAAITYTIQPKDTLYSIAKSNHISVSDLQKANGIGENDLLKIGRDIKIPSGKTSSDESVKSVRTAKSRQIKSASSAKIVKSAKSKPSKRKSSAFYGICRKDGSDVWQENNLVASLDKGARVEILDRDDGEYKVRLSNGKTGWILENWVTMKDTRRSFPMSDRSVSSSGTSCGDIVQVAMAYKGSRYSRGGMTSRGFDCSGFVKFLYKSKGISLPHSSSAQFGCGQSISRSELQPGDVVFFAGTYRPGISHVGLYIGDNKFIHASTSRGGVRVDDLSSAYYSSKFAGAKRIK
jgi:cell wall-associated NlpC family hydrolase